MLVGTVNNESEGEDAISFSNVIIMTDNSGHPDADMWVKDALGINDEDKPLVEGQCPEDLPLDLREEVHIPADRMSLEYRRALAGKFGLGAPISS